MANETTYTLNDSFTQWPDGGGGEVRGHIDLGKGETNGEYDSAYRFTNIPIAQGTTVSYAHIKVYCSAQAGSGVIRTKTYGIKETNTAAFTSNPFGRTKTTASSDADFGVPGVGSYVDLDVGQQLNEIVGQAGWASGNAAGFFSIHDGSDASTYVYDWVGSTYLVLRVAAEPEFFPTPVTKDATGMPAKEDFGIRVSQPGIDVKIATEDQLYFTTRKRELRVKQEKTTTVPGTGETWTKINHGLSYSPAVLGYASGPNFKFKLPRYFWGAADPINEGIKGFIAATNTQIWVSAGGVVYYYIFLDPLE